MIGRNDKSEFSAGEWPVGEPMRCARARDLVALVPGSELPAAVDRAVRHHLAGCVSCRKELGAHLAVQRALQSLTPQSRPADAEFFASLRADTLAALTCHRPQRVSLAGVLTAAALFLVGILLTARWLPPGDSWRDAPSLVGGIQAAQPDSSTRIREVGYYYGYGLLGRHRMTQDHLAREVVPSEVPGVIDLGDAAAWPTATQAQAETSDRKSPGSSPEAAGKGR